VLVKYLKDNWFGPACRWRDFVTMQRLLTVGLDTYAGKLLDTNNSCERKHLTLMEAVFSRRVFRNPAKMFRTLLLGARNLAEIDIEEQESGERQHAAQRRLPVLAWRLLLRALVAVNTPGAGPKEPATQRHKDRYFFVPHSAPHGPDEAGCGVADTTNVAADADAEDVGAAVVQDSDSDSGSGIDDDGGAAAVAVQRIAEYEARAAVVAQAGADVPETPEGHHLVDSKLLWCSCPYNAVWGRTPAVSGRLGCVHVVIVLLCNPRTVLKAAHQALLRAACVVLNEGYTNLVTQAGVGPTKWHDEGPATGAGCECTPPAHCPLPALCFVGSRQ
jgi:hypothetical protein